MSGGRRCVEVPVIEIGKDAEDKTRRQAVDDLFLFKAGRWRAMRRWRDQRKADYFHLGRGIFRRINAASPSASAPLRPPPSLHLCGSQLEYAPQSENSTFEPSQSTFEQAPTTKNPFREEKRKAPTQTGPWQYFGARGNSPAQSRARSGGAGCFRCGRAAAGGFLRGGFALLELEAHLVILEFEKRGERASFF